tara:strand:- start:68 stop:730 length:663 start_codon:yes stop_codon:yes gene_type:complete
MFTYIVNRKRFESSEPKITGRNILEEAGLTPVEDYELLYEINKKGFTPIQLDEVVDLRKVGIEGFKASLYKSIKIKIDNKEIEVDDCFMTPIEVLAAAGFDFNSFYLVEMRSGGVEVSYKDDVEHKIAINRKSSFITYKIETVIECIIVNAKPKAWYKPKISFDEVVQLAYGAISPNPNVIYTINYIKGVPAKPEGSMVKGDEIFVNNKMIFNVTRTDKS